VLITDLIYDSILPKVTAPRLGAITETGVFNSSRLSYAILRFQGLPLISVISSIEKLKNVT
jgi:hypothetical protein